ncbi:MAG TPA: MFS transporter [Bacilli bacterium]|nr:MAG: Major Facilitator Superfamily protein [Tenericutes bacterium ADurb.BinA124]HNZ50860.1 MFS transporter [Bacilli bacterium]HOH18290.1 MFS transporter [Bacilli bacterium]HPX84310.1 MFS transporter [Bacilli bacterium]
MEQQQIKRGIINIIFLGLVSFFIDLSTEMVYPLVTLYLQTFASVPIVGVIEGFAESTAALLKVYSGYLGDKYQNKKTLAFFGYSSAIAYKNILFFSGSWVGIMIARLVDRFGKGIRTAPRDALVAESGEAALGKSFGLHKMLDMLGAGLGILIAYLLYQQLVKDNMLIDIKAFKTIFLLSIIPAVLGLVFLSLVRERKKNTKWGNRFTLKGLKLNPRLKWYLVVILLFSLGNSSNAFLLLKATDAGYTTSFVLLLYLVYHLVSTIFAFPMGKWSDRIGRHKLVVPGYLLYGFLYFGFAFLTSKVSLMVLFGAYGLYQAIISGAEKAFITEFAPKDAKGTIIGLYGTCQGVGILVASLLAGGLWTWLGARAPFVFASIMGLAAAVLAFLVMTHQFQDSNSLKKV